MASGTVAIRSDAGKLAALLNKDNQFAEDVEVMLDAARDQKRSKSVIWYDFRRIFGIDGMRALPIVDSEGGNNPDKYKITVFNEKTKNNVSKPMSYYADLFDASEAGILIAQDKADLEAVSAGTANDDNQFYDMTNKKDLIDSMKATLDQRRSNGVSLYKGAALVEQTINRINDEMPKVKVIVAERYDDETKAMTLRKTTKPILLHDYETGVMTGFQVCSVGKLLSFDIDKAIKEGGTLTSLWTSTKTEPGMTAGDGPTTKDNVESRLASFMNFVEKNRSGFVQALGKMDDEGKLTFVAFKNELVAYCEANNLDALAETIQAERNRKIVEERKGKTAA